MKHGIRRICETATRVFRAIQEAQKELDEAKGEGKWSKKELKHLGDLKNHLDSAQDELSMGFGTWVGNVLDPMEIYATLSIQGSNWREVVKT